MSASIAAERDLSPIFVGQWKLPLAKETRAALAKVDWSGGKLDPAQLSRTLEPAWIVPDPAAE